MRASSSIVITAALSIAVLFGAFGMRVGEIIRARTVVVDTSSLEPVQPPNYLTTEDADQNGLPDWQDELVRSGVAMSSSSATSSTESEGFLSTIAEDVANMLYGGYVSLKQYDAYSPTKGDELGTRVAAQIRAPQNFKLHTIEEIVLEEDTSEARVLSYRADMREALAPMVTEDQPEFELFARYLETHDPLWLTQISLAAKRYRAAEANALKVSVPKDASPEHLRALNALGSYADVLERMASITKDNTLAYVALLQTHSDSEEQLFASFDSLAKYYVRKVTN